MLAVLQDAPGQPDGIPNVWHRAHGPSLQGSPLHERGVCFHIPGRVEDGTPSGVKEGVIFQKRHCLLHRIQGCPPLTQALPSYKDCLFTTLLPLGPVVFWNVTCAPVDDDDRPHAAGPSATPSGLSGPRSTTCSGFKMM